MTRTVFSIPKKARAYQGHRAGLVSRLLATGVDLAVTLTTVVVLYAAWTTLRFIVDPRGFESPRPPLVVYWLVAMAVLTVYLTASWSTTGRSYGQHIMGLRVVDMHGGLLRVWVALLRAVLCVVFPVGLLWVAISRQNRSLQDLVLRTSVIHDWLIRVPSRRE
jgi:uncharacterized RDD family membrane protein YckC